MRHLCLHVGLIVTLVGSMPSRVKAQDSHYATHQFGARSNLMGGAVVGFAKDNSSIYYNPGSLSFVDSNSITLTTNMYQMERITIAAPVPGLEQIKSKQVASIPLMVSGMIGQRKSRFKIGYGVISPLSFRYRTSNRISSRFPVVNDTISPGAEAFVGHTSLYSSLSEVQGILAFGYKLNRHWGLGLSNFAIGRTQDFSKSFETHVTLNDANQNVSGYSVLREANYFHLRYAAKAGVCYRNKKFFAGLTVRSPSISVAGNGGISAEVVGTKALYNGSRTDFSAFDSKEGLKVKYKTPLEVVLGFNWTYRKSTIGFALEYHARQKIYTVLSAATSNFENPVGLSQTLGAQDILRLQDGAKPVTNFSIGYEYAITRNLYLITSFRTNRSFYDHDLDNLRSVKTGISTWDLVHARAGLTVKQGHSQLSFGFLFATGHDNNRPQTGEFSILNEGEQFAPNLQTSKATYQSLGFMLGYSFLLFDLY